jgi:XTP/dITP diphosphohydrolase
LPAALTLVLATRNEGKVRELTTLLADLPLEVKSLLDFPQIGSLPEEGDSYAVNARSKALAVAQATGQVALADDSGLEVDALGGAPGVHSSRWLGDEATDAVRNAAVLERLRGVPAERRTARFRAVVAVALPDLTVRTFDGVVEGRIAEEPAGDHGFGYDPIFLPREHDQTMAELGPDVKDRISHRAAAVRAARAYLATLARGIADAPRREEPEQRP